MTAVVVENGAEVQRLHSKRSRCYCNWVAAVVGCYSAAAIERLCSAGCSDLLLPAEETRKQHSKRLNT